MARTLHRLTSKQAETLGPGRHADGGGLYLDRDASGRSRWVFFWTRNGKRREMGLGSASKGGVGLADARRAAAAARDLVAQGADPIAERENAKKAPEAVPTFGTEAEAFVTSLSPQWRNEKHRAQWAMTLRVYAKALAPRPIDEIATAEVLAVLQPIWLSKPETAARLRGRIERVLDAAKAKGHRTGENPARWRGHLDHLLPKRQKLTRGHHAAVPFIEAPKFVRELRSRDGVSARALEFLILTAARSGEVLGATWSEIDLEGGVWTVPAARMKAGREHRVPLSRRALCVLEAVRPLSESAAGSDQPVFPSQQARSGLSSMALTMTMRRMGTSATAHGFRSTFRDWAGELSTFPREIAEAALAHVVGDMTERAYRRGDALEKRRLLMESWASYCDGEPQSGSVVTLRQIQP